jgi:putative flippase GtrA
MFTFLKANIASLAASLSDFLITVLLVQGCKTAVVTAAAAGTVTGGIINFLIGRHWVFKRGTQNAERKTQNAECGTQNVERLTQSPQHRMLYFAFGVKRLAFSIKSYFALSVKRLAFSVQLGKYALVWAGNLLLNTGGVYVLACEAGMHYTASKVVTSILVAFLYNYPLQKNFVFSNNW